MRTFIFNITNASLLLILFSCTSKNITQLNTYDIIENKNNTEGYPITVFFQKGESFNHPSFAIWVEDTTGNYIQTLYVTKAVGTGVFTYGKPKGRSWVPSEKRRPSSLPYWSHKRGIKEEDGFYIPDSIHPVTDALTSATPQNNFELHLAIKDTGLKQFNILFEINQTWDFNEYWTNNKYPDNEAYKASCQPSVIYSGHLDLINGLNDIELKPIGHGHYAGEDGELYPDLSTLTTALKNSI